MIDLARLLIIYWTVEAVTAQAMAYAVAACFVFRAKRHGVIAEALNGLAVALLISLSVATATVAGRMMLMIEIAALS